MTKRQNFHRWLSLAAEARRLGQKGFAKTCLRHARSVRWCPYHRAFDALPTLPA